jgi:methionyl aminopeptidase
MSVIIKTEEQIEKMRVAGRLAAQVLEMIEPFVVAGVTTQELNDRCHEFTLANDALSAPLFYPSYDENDDTAFPKSICTSINTVVCHGVPNERPLEDGDILNMDITVIKNGFHGDTSKMFFIGEVSPRDKQLCRISQEALYEGLRQVKPGARLSRIGEIIEKKIKAHNKANPTRKYSIVEEYCGHGIGDKFHEEPQVLHYKSRFNESNQNLVLKEGMCFTIEPMINAGKKHNVVADDHWTVLTKDNKNSAQWEHTLVVTKDGCEILTLRDEETIPRILKN